VNLRATLWPIKWLVTLLALAGLLGAACSVHNWMQAERAAEGGDKVQSSVQVQFGVVKLGVKRAELNGLKDAPATSIPWSDRVMVYGQVVPNPRASVEVRTAFAGTLRAADNAPWPAPGEWVRADQMLGRLEVRAGPQERLEWQSKLAEAHLKLQGAEEVLKIEQARIDRFKSISSDVISRRDLDDAMLRLTEAKTQREVAQAAAKLWQAALAESEKPGSGPSLWNQVFTAPADGEVTELLARPGMAVEPGAVVARLVDFRRPLVRLDLPADVLAAGPPRQVSLSSLNASPPALRGISNQPEAGRPAPTVQATLAGAGPQIDPASQSAPYWYEVNRPSTEKAGNGRAWRPGLFVKAEIALPDARQQRAVAVPATALLYHQGRALVYVRIDPGRYERREVQILGRDGDRWVLGAGVQAGEDVVYEQAQVLLSQEFNTDND
jgi:RND family efflux transporter MFP subunit